MARTGLPVVRSNEQSQQGTTFGQRLAHAVSGVFDRGFERVIVVGNDCVSLQTSHLRAAARILEQGKQVLGPDQRGGAWLIGLQRNRFDATAFADLRWATTEVHTDLAVLLGDTVSLASLSDVNSLGDLKRLWRIVRTQVSELFDLILVPASVFAGTGIGMGPARVEDVSSRGPPRSYGL